MAKQRLKRGAFAVLALPLAFALNTTIPKTTGLNAAADSFTSSAAPTTNYGKSRALYAKSATPAEVDYLRFKVPDTDPILSATLYLYSSNTTFGGITVSPVTNAWDELKITHANRPAIGTASAPGRSLYKGRVAIDVTPFLAGKGTYSFAVLGLSTTTAKFSSREGSQPPRLILKTSAAAPATSPTPSLTPSLLPTESADPSASPSVSPSSSSDPSPDPSSYPSSSPSPSATDNPEPSAGSVITNPQSVFSVPRVGKHGYMDDFIDPVFGTTVTRIVGAAGSTISFSSGGSGTWGSDARQHYNEDQAWNADGSLLWLENKTGASPSRVILDGNTYKPKMKPCSNYSYYDDRWHPTRAHVRVAWEGTTIQWFDIATCDQLRKWTAPFSMSMDSEAGPSRDGSMWALGDSKRVFAVRMDPLPGKVGPAFDMASNCGLSNCTVDHVAISPSGDHVLVHYEGDHDRILDINPSTLALTPHAYPSGTPECSGHSPSKGFIFDLGHADHTFDVNGDDIVVGQNRSWCPQKVDGVSLGQIYSVRLKDGKVTSLIHPGSAQAYHISCRNFRRPGWCYASFWPGSGEAFNDEIIAFRLDGSGRVERLVHTHTDTDGCYRCEAHPVPSPDGLRVLFASSWTLNCGTSCGSQTNPQAYIADTRALR